MWRGQVANAMRGRRGQTFLKDLVSALDAMPAKRLIRDDLIRGGEVCAIGALGLQRGIDMSKIDPEDSERVAHEFNIAHQLASEVVYMNDDYFDFHYVENKRVEYTPEERWQLMRDWAAKKIRS